jgi:hypothetical protein
MAYRWFTAWLPIFAVLMGLLAILWVYVSFIQPPALKDQWSKIETKWAPARATAWTQLDKAAKATPFDLAAYQTAAGDYETQLKGWLAEVLPSGRTASYWGLASDGVSQLQSDIDSVTQRLDKIKAATTIFDFLPSEGALTGFDDGINNDVYAIRNALHLSQPATTPSAFPFPAITPTPSPSASGSPGATSSAPAIVPAPSPSAS